MVLTTRARLTELHILRTTKFEITSDCVLPEHFNKLNLPLALMFVQESTMDFESRKSIAIEIMQAKGVRTSVATPLFWRLVWFLGIECPPPLFASPYSNFFVGAAWGAILIVVVCGIWSPSTIFVATLAGFMSGGVSALFYHRRARINDLPQWNEIGLDSGESGEVTAKAPTGGAASQRRKAILAAVVVISACFAAVWVSRPITSNVDQHQRRNAQTLPVNTDAKRTESVKSEAIHPAVAAPRTKDIHVQDNHAFTTVGAIIANGEKQGLTSQWFAFGGHLCRSMQGETGTQLAFAVECVIESTAQHACGALALCNRTESEYACDAPKTMSGISPVCSAFATALIRVWRGER
jgi:hypothetical protein